MAFSGDHPPHRFYHAGSVQFSDILKDGMGFAALAHVPTPGLAQILAFGGIAETVAMP